jgi:hypothetical protein
VKISRGWARPGAAFDEDNLVSFAGLIPVLELARRAGLGDLVAEHVAPSAGRVASAGANPAGKVAAIVAGMAAGADCIDDLDLIRCGGMGRVFDQVYAPATLGQFLREFTAADVEALSTVAAAHLVGQVELTDALPGREEQAFIDIDSLLRPVYGHAKQGASFGFTQISGRMVLRRGLSPPATTISTATGAPLIAGIRLRSGRTASNKGAASMITEAIATARAAGANGAILVRGDASYGNRSVITACRAAGAHFSLVLIRNPAVDRAIASIPEKAWRPVHYPGAVIDPDTGALISDAQVAETAFTAFTGRRRSEQVTARLIVRRVRDRATDPDRGELFPVWRHHPFFTDTDLPTEAADITHRRHAIIETVFADLIDGPLAHLPSGRFAANAAWAVCAMITHNLLRAAGTLAAGTNAVARGATLRRQLLAVPARTARPQGRTMLHLPTRWPWATAWQALWDNIFPPNATGPPVPS